METDLTSRPERREDLPGWYAAALLDQSRSGLSMTDYAGELGVTAATLYQWRRRLAAEVEVDAEFETPTSLGLIEVCVSDDMPAEQGAPLVVRLRSGRCVEVPPRFRDADLIRLIELLDRC